MNEIARLKRRLRRQKEARKQAEWIAEEKTRELFQRNQELLELSHSQEQTIQERTKNLEFQNVMLEQSRKELMIQKRELAEKTRDLEKSNRYKDEFLTSISHELRTPLNALMILTDLLIEGAGSEEPTPSQKDSLLLIKSNTEDLLALINAILDMSELVAGRLQIHQGTVPLEDITDSLVSRYREKAAEKGLAFNFELGEGIPASIDTDAVRLIQVLDGLLDNALKFTDQGSIGLSISVDHEPCQQWVIKIKDTGIGINEENHTIIFESFLQVEGGMGRAHGGTGTGLSLCKRLIELMGGIINLKSTPESGSEFSIHLPIFNNAT
ncbi:ATP-binding protein [Endozoicomonas sp. Mp262]|uniref:sensor histidine kinase n=1 Tax=Endozoicomonas sp. Mp262 TaxID=2919499 RepID=UPI0021D7FC1B